MPSLSKRRLTKGGSIRNSFRRLLGKSSKTKSKSKIGTVASRHAVAAHTRATQNRVKTQLRRLERNQVRRTQRVK
jgi:hypothetical protein